MPLALMPVTPMLLALTATAAGAQTSPPVARADTVDGPVLAAALAALPPATRTQLAALADSVRTAGLPAAALDRKVIEGVAKHADPARIVSVVSRVAEGLRTAGAALGPASAAELEAAGAAVQSGVTLDQLRRVRASLPRTRPITQALVVLTDLTRRGVSPGDGVQALTRLTRAGARDTELARWRSEVAADVAGGMGGDAAVTRQTETFLQRRQPPNAPVVTPLPGPLDP